MTLNPPAPPRAPTIPGPIKNPRRPTVKFSAGACDCHAHIFGPQDKYPLDPATHYVPPSASLDDYAALLNTLGCDRGVIVHPSIYGTDNRCTLDALRSGRLQLRGVAVIDERTSDEELEDMHQAGIRGVRLHLQPRNAAQQLALAPRVAERIRRRNWHMQYYFNFAAMPEIEEQLTRLPVNVVIDHFAHAEVAQGPGAPGYQALMRLAQRDNLWFKLMGAYRISDTPPKFEDVAPLAQALVAAAPDRCVWGTDWPHPNAKYMPDDGDLADMLATWVADAATRKRILVDNPARLYDF